MRPGVPNHLRQTIARQFTLGGSLSIANGLSWVCFYSGGHHLPESMLLAMTPLLLLLAFPIAIPCLVPSLGGPTVPEIVVCAIVIGINSLFWGHGIAWLFRRCRERFAPDRMPADTVEAPR